MINQEKLGELIEKAARTNQCPETKQETKPFSPGFLVVYLCNEEIDGFDTYYYSAKANAEKLTHDITQRIKECSSHLITELEKQNTELVKERDELNKQCGEFQEGFFEYMGLCDHLQIEVDNLKKKIVNLTTPDTSKKN